VIPVPEAREVSEEERSKAEDIASLAKKCLDGGAADTAADVLLDATDIDPTNVGYRLKRCEAVCAYGAMTKKLWDCMGSRPQKRILRGATRLLRPMLCFSQSLHPTIVRSGRSLEKLSLAEDTQRRLYPRTSERCPWPKTRLSEKNSLMALRRHAQPS
jgi:hypothetical protein